MSAKPPKQSGSKKPLGDRELWRLAMRDTKPLRRKEPHLPDAQGPASKGKVAESPKAKGATSTPRSRIRDESSLSTKTPLQPAPATPRELTQGDVSGLDRRLAQRLKRGKLPIEAVLDLHGLRQDEAHRQLDRFILSNRTMGRRCLLIVTGKGLGREEGGVLKRQVPLWLNQEPLRSAVLSFSYAQPHHGGQGALYILLKKKAALA